MMLTLDKSAEPRAWNENPEGLVDRRENLTQRAFRHEYLRPLKPVVLVGALNRCPAMGKWTPSFFRDNYADMRVLASNQEYLFSEYLDLIETSTPTEPAPYLFNFLIDEQFPELMPDITPWPEYLSPNWLERPGLPGGLGRQLRADTRPGLFIGGPGTGAPKLHFDLGYHSFSFQFHGRKKFFFYPTEQTPLMYPSAESPCLSDIMSVEEPDLGMYPRFRESEPITCVLEPGDLLFIPGGWWHTTRILSVSVSVSVNTVNAAAWGLMLRERYDQMRPSHPWLVGPIIETMRAMGMIRAGWERLKGTY